MPPDERAAPQRRPLVLDVPDPPPDLPYREVEDFQNREILKANGVGLSTRELLSALDDDVNVIQAAAAHVLGEMGEQAAMPRLRELVASPDDLVKVEAGYALARLGAEDGARRLAGFLQDPLEGYISAPLAAGLLARLGDPRGWPVIVEALGSTYPEIRMIAAKQLSLFMPFEPRDGAGGSPDVTGQIGRALADPSTDQQWQVLRQLRDAPSGRLRPMLETYLSGTSDPGLRRAAEAIIELTEDRSGPTRGGGRASEARP